MSGLRVPSKMERGPLRPGGNAVACSRPLRRNRLCLPEARFRFAATGSQDRYAAASWRGAVSRRVQARTGSLLQAIFAASRFSSSRRNSSMSQDLPLPRIEATLLHLADKLVSDTHIISLDARKKNMRMRYGADQNALLAIRQRYAAARKTARRIERITGQSLETLLQI